MDRACLCLPSGLVYVNVRGGIPPVLAQHDPALYFVPRDVQAEMPAREAMLDVAPTSESTFVAGPSGKSNDQRCEPLAPFVPPARRPFEADAETLLLLRFDGDTTALAPQSAALAVELK